MYVETPIKLHHYYAKWHYLLDELKHKRRFFNAATKEFFGELFGGVEILKYWDKEKSEFESVVLELPEATNLYRSRVCNSIEDLTNIFNDPLKHVGPPPKHLARGGRMNAEGVVVFYGAMDLDTCLAEMRPALASDIAIITLSTTKPLRLLDFTRLEQARGGGALSYFQLDFTTQVEKRKFVRRLHSLISQPIIPSKESDYIITQTMVEYLAHVHPEPFDGILFASAQRAGGVNIVLFPDSDVLIETSSDLFPLTYVEDSIKLLRTESIKYTHVEIDVFVDKNGDAHTYGLYKEDPDDD